MSKEVKRFLEADFVCEMKSTPNKGTYLIAVIISKQFAEVVVS